MNKALAIGITFFGLLLTAGLAQGPTRYTQALYPLKLGQRWTYRVTDMKSPVAKPDPKKVVVVEVEKEEEFSRPGLDKAGKPIIKDGKQVTEKFVSFVLRSQSGDKVTRDEVVILKDGFYRLSRAGTTLNPPFKFFKIPDQKGVDSWTWDYEGVNGEKPMKGTFKASYDRVAVPAHTGEAIKVVYQSTDGSKAQIESWYASDLGMVKQHVKTKDHEIMMELLKFEKGK